MLHGGIGSTGACSPTCGPTRLLVVRCGQAGGLVTEMAVRAWALDVSGNVCALSRAIVVVQLLRSVRDLSRLRSAVVGGDALPAECLRIAW